MPGFIGLFRTKPLKFIIRVTRITYHIARRFIGYIKRLLVFFATLNKGNFLGLVDFHRAEKFSAEKPTVIVFSFTPLASEPRVLRQSKSFLRSNWNVVLVGYGNLGYPPPEYSFINLPLGCSESRLLRYRLGAQMLIGRKLAQVFGSYALGRFGARLNYRSIPQWRSNWINAKQTLEQHKIIADLVMAHDYFTCPLAFSIAKRHSAPVIIDVHEYAVGQYANDPTWIKKELPLVRALQDHYFVRAERLFSVSDGIVQLLNNQYRLKRPAVRLLSVPFRQILPFRDTGDEIKCLKSDGINVRHAS